MGVTKINLSAAQLYTLLQPLKGADFGETYLNCYTSPIDSVRKSLNLLTIGSWRMPSPVTDPTSLIHLLCFTKKEIITALYDSEKVRKATIDREQVARDERREKESEVERLQAFFHRLDPALTFGEGRPLFPKTLLEKRQGQSLASGLNHHIHIIDQAGPERILHWEFFREAIPHNGGSPHHDILRAIQRGETSLIEEPQDDGPTNDKTALTGDEDAAEDAITGSDELNIIVDAIARLEDAIKYCEQPDFTLDQFRQIAPINDPRDFTPKQPSLFDEKGKPQGKIILYNDCVDYLAQCFIYASIVGKKGINQDLCPGIARGIADIIARRNKAMAPIFAKP